MMRRCRSAKWRAPAAPHFRRLLRHRNRVHLDRVSIRFASYADSHGSVFADHPDEVGRPGIFRIIQAQGQSIEEDDCKRFCLCVREAKALLKIPVAIDVSRRILWVILFSSLSRHFESTRVPDQLSERLNAGHTHSSVATRIEGAISFLPKFVTSLSSSIGTRAVPRHTAPPVT